MTDLLEQAISAVKRLPPERQDNVAEAMLALAEFEASQSCDLPLTGEAPSEEEILTLLPTVMPTATTTKAEAEAWSRLPSEERLRRYRLALSHPDCDRESPDGVQDVLARVLKRNGQ